MNRWLLLFLVVSLFDLPFAHAKVKKTREAPAQQDQSTVAPPAEAPKSALTEFSPPPTKDPNKAPGEDVDEIITNKLMRAQSGSKSRLSISNAINYQGGTVQYPTSERRPNITNGTASTAVANLQDSIAGKFAIDQRHAVLAGGGVRWITPFQSLSNVPSGYRGQKFDIYDPYIKYQYVYKWSGIQSVFVAGLTYTTQTNLLKQGFLGNITLQQNNIYEIGKTGISVGVLGFVTFTGYRDRDPLYMDTTSDYAGGLYPFLEYTINSWLNLRTITGLWVFEHLRSTGELTTFNKNTIYESIGVGISVTRDVFLYPNVQFLPEHIRADQTNVALAATINIF